MANALPEYLRIESALKKFVLATSTQSQEHIKPLHKYISLRLVIQGGFLPNEITPHAPLHYQSSGGRHQLVFDPTQERETEQVIVGGIKSKKVDVVVNKEGVGPVICISMKGTRGAFRNLTNRMEELIGDCANLHMMYPGLVFGFLHVLRGNWEGPGVERNDVCVKATGEVVGSIERWHDVLVLLTGRKMIFDDLMRYEAVLLLIAETRPPSEGTLFPTFPPGDSPLSVDSFFSTLFNLYDLRFQYKESSRNIVKRLEWDENSPAFADIRRETGLELSVALGYTPRIA